MTGQLTQERKRQIEGELKSGRDVGHFPIVSESLLWITPRHTHTHTHTHTQSTTVLQPVLQSMSPERSLGVYVCACGL